VADERIAKRPRGMSRFKSNAEGVRETDVSGFAVRVSGSQARK
jgi:hypothetical protein